MNPIYKFDLTVGNVTERAYPVYSDELAIHFEKESGQQFFRRKLSGDLTFQSNDYDRIVSASFDTRFGVKVSISYDGGSSWSDYWNGTFWKTDCKFDAGSKTVIVTPDVNDAYGNVLAGLDKEFDLISLAPEIVSVQMDKRPMIQVYVPGQTSIGCFLSGMWWEQECEAVTDKERLTEIGDGKLNFALNKSTRVFAVSGSAIVPEVFMGDTFAENVPGMHDFTNGNYTFRYNYVAVTGGSYVEWQILQGSTVMWTYRLNGAPPTVPNAVTLSPVSGTGASGDLSVSIYDIEVYARYVVDVEAVNNVGTYLIGTDDIVPNNRNYTRVVGYNFPSTITLSSLLTTTPTEWGIYQPGRYYRQPGWMGEYFPVARNAWGRVSIWFSFFVMDWAIEETARKPFVLKDAYPLWSVLSVLLGQIAPGITFGSTADYSQFLYGTTPLGTGAHNLVITPKSNVINSGYDQPARKAPITLGNVLTMLRDCFRCYWWIDSQNKLRVEQIDYFRRGGTYSGWPVVGVDLTTLRVPRNGKEWSFARRQYEFDKPEMAERYQFGWMDDVTQPFEGYPIDIISGYVQQGNIEQIDVSRFTSDVDYILLNPTEISKDGFVILSTGDQSADIWHETLTASVEIQASGETDTNIDISQYRGRRIRLKIIAPVRVAIYEDNSNHTVINLIDILEPSSAEQTLEYTVTENGSYISVYVWTDATITVTSLAYTEGVEAMTAVKYWQKDLDHIMQNGFLSFDYMQRYYAYDMPASRYEINGVEKIATGVRKLKRQSLNFPALYDPDLLKLIKTNLGEGVITDLSVNLCSRNANVTLYYDTE